MPLSKYFKGEGEKVMDDMKGRYGDKDGERAFYATANKTGMRPGGKKDKAKKSKPGIIGSRIKASDI